ncbi:histone-lysine N-methyltransferase SETDB1-B, partial [Ixodes scapularis]|uniref:histone-lysine N-methyltransferase SETDB1-B n=1 Tax=Ixodes scapularis TaxID=6945 RepID=UPI001A9CED25
SESQRAGSEEEASLGDSDVPAERSGRAKRTDRAVQPSLGKRTDPGFAVRGSSSPEQQLPETVTALAGQVESIGHSKSTQTAEEDVSRSAGGTEDASDISGKIEEVGGVVYRKKPKRYKYGARKYKKGPIASFKKFKEAQSQVESIGHSKSTQTAEEDVSRSAGGTEDASEGAAVTEDASDISGKIEEVGEIQRLGSHVEDVATLCEDEFRSTGLLETFAGVVYRKKPKRYKYGARKYKKGPIASFKKFKEAQRKKIIAEGAKASVGGDGMTLSALERDGDCEGGLEGANGEGPSGVKCARLEEEQFVVCDCDIAATVNKVIGGSELERAWKDEMAKFSRRLGVLQDLEREFLEIDIGFDKMERDLEKLKAKKSKDEADALIIPEVHFFDVFINDSRFKMPGSPNRALQSTVVRTSPAQKGSPRPAQKSSDDIIPVGKFTPKVPNLPPEGPIVRKELDISSRVLATRNFPLGVFFKARITEVRPAEETDDGEPMYHIKFEARKPNAGMRQSKWFSPRELAYADRPPVVLPIGTRVVATYTDESWNQRQSLYAGLIAEPPKPLNRYRYLVFFDDGYAQYVHIDKVFVMCGTSKTGVWDDMYRDVRDFVKTYLQKYPERPMLRMRKGQTVKTEWNGKWWMARVLTVDASLAKMAFEADDRTEWIYRGSTRFAPLYTALSHTAQQSAAPGGRVRRQNLVPATGKQHRPFVEYTREADESSSAATATKGDETKKAAAAITASDKRNAARKSAAQDRKSVPWEEPEVAASQAGTRELRCVEGSSTYRRKIYLEHECSPTCVEPEDPEKLVGHNPLSIPCLMGWERQLAKLSKKTKRRVFYTAPCGRRLRNIAEVAQYLVLSKCLLTVDQFCFDSAVNVFAHFEPQTVLSSLKDLTYGKELVPVTCINSLSTEYPSYIEYSATRYPGKGVTLNLDKEFLCGCDCEDDCQDRDKCSCQQLTVAATGALPSGVNPSAGYRFRRLHEPLITGVYECNAQCKCSKRCQNRVVQNGLRCRLQVFRTEKRGWGVRCLDDLPQGCFVCIYAGQLLTEQGANEDGNQYGDEYLAELDHIEVVEKQKEGYESDVVNSEEEEEGDEEAAVSDYDDDSVDEEELKEDMSDSDGDTDTTETNGKIRKSQRTPKKKEKSEDGDTDESKDKPRDKPKMEPRKLGTKLEESPRKVTDDESSESKSQDGRSADQTGDDSQSSTMSEKPKKPLKVKKTAKKEADKAGKGDGKVKTGPLESPGIGGKRLRFPPTRSFFNEEYCYIMDAKNCGNIGRYLNHSCCPNVYVQNVFVDSHDLRFPWVAFFASRYIRAGMELTWDYNYDVGSVPERVMYCQCGAEECRGRLI